MRLILNVIWLIFGGLWLALGYLLAALICFVLIITIPFGFASLRIASYALWPFGRTIVDKPGTGPGALIGNIIWVVLFGWWLALGHLVSAVAMAITIIGIPLALADLKLIPVSLLPLGKEIVPVDQARQVRRRHVGRRDADRAGPTHGARGPPVDCPPCRSDGPLVDTFGRVATDLRVSLTDRCNLRCTYCMPAEGLDWLPGEQLLRPDELNRLLRIAVTRLGITSVRFTGGEPLLAKHLEDIVAATAALRPRPEIALTTNGVGLARRATGAGRSGPGPRQRLAGQRRRRALRRDHPPGPAATTCSAGLAAARQAGLGPVKVNAVLDPVTGRDDVVALLRFCLDARLPAAHHRADAVGRRTSVAPRRHPDRRRHLGHPRRAFQLAARPAARAARPRPSCGRSTAVRPPSASSRRCRTRSARRATAPG